MNIFLKEELYTKHTYDISGHDADKIVCLKEEDCIIHSDGHIYKNEKHHLCNKWYHKPTNDKKISEIHKDTHVLSLIQKYNKSFQHITFDTLPKIPLIKKLIKNDNLVKIMVMNETQQNMIQKFGDIPQERFIVRENNRISYRVKVGYYINFINSDGNGTRMGSSGYNTLKDYVIENNAESTKKYLCYISRRNKRFREIDYNDENKLIEGLETLCKEKGLEMKYFNNPKDPEELINILKDTLIFISAHGGAMGNMIWLNKKSRVIEIIPLSGLVERPSFYYLANSLGLDYTIFEPLVFDFKKKQISIDVDRLLKQVQNISFENN